MMSNKLLTLVNRFGKSVTLRAVTTGTYNVSTGSVTNTTSDTTVKAYFGNYTLEEMDGSSIVKGDRKVVVNTLDTSNVSITEPKVGDLIVGEDDTVSIVSVQKILSGTTPTCYICQVRE